MPEIQTANEDEVAVGYGMLDVAHGGQLQEAFDHIEKFKDIDPVSWFFDVVHTPNQRDRAIDWGKQIVAFISKQHPDLSDGNITVCLNLSSKKILEARNTLFEIMYHGNTEEIKYKSTEEHDERAT